MAITCDPVSGWSEAIRLNGAPRSGRADTSYATNDSNYGNPVNATWFTKAWWDGGPYYWARKFINRTEKTQIPTMIGFCTCPCNSKGKAFLGSGGIPAGGDGCEYICDIFVKHSNGIAEAVTADSSMKMDPIDEFNCWYGGYNQVSTSNYQTAFGRPEYFGSEENPNAYTYYTDSSGNKILRAWRFIRFSFSDAPAIAPGEEMYVNIRILQWFPRSNSCQLLIVAKDMDGFDYDFSQEPRRYVWKYVANREEDEPEDAPNGPHWKKITKLYKYYQPDGESLGWHLIGDQPKE